MRPTHIRNFGILLSLVHYYYCMTQGVLPCCCVASIPRRIMHYLFDFSHLHFFAHTRDTPALLAMRWVVLPTYFHKGGTAISLYDDIVSIDILPKSSQQEIITFSVGGDLSLCDRVLLCYYDGISRKKILVWER